MRLFRHVSARKSWIALGIVLALSATAFSATDPKNLALKKPATASAAEDGNPPENAVDGDEGNSWCTSESGTCCWWQVDLGAPQQLGGCEVIWEHDGAVYQYIIEGSADGKTWKPLNDQRGSQWDSDTQKLLLAGDAARYVRIRITGLDDGSWASFCEFKLFAADDIKKLTPEELKAFHNSAPVLTNIALKKPVSTSSNEEAHPGTDANDGDDQTRWCAADGTTPQWWMVDLADKPAASAAAPAAGTAPVASADIKVVHEVDIRWAQTKAYQFVVEGSLDGKKWEMLSDQKANTAQFQATQLHFTPREARYVRITVTGLEEGAYASIDEVKVLGAKK